MFEDSFYFFSVEGVEFVIAANDEMSVEDLFPDRGRRGLYGLYAFGECAQRIDPLVPSRAIIHITLVRRVHDGITLLEGLCVYRRRNNGVTNKGIQLTEKEGLIPYISYSCM